MVCLFSCDSDIEYLELENDSLATKTRAITNVQSFSDCEEAVLPSKSPVLLPWVNGAQTVIPDEIRKDVKAEDGWIILDSTIEFVGYSYTPTRADKGSNYLLLYNERSGVLKGFYYAETMNKNNCGFFQLSTSTPTKLFNFYSNFAIPMDEPGPDIVNLTTMTSNAVTKGFERGWNCFAIELAYDPNSSNQNLNVSGWAMNNAVGTFKGAYNSTSSGTIVTAQGGTSNLIKGTAAGVGAAGKKWILDNTGKDGGSKVIKYAGELAGEFLNKGVGGLIEAGLHKVFSSFLGTSSTNYDLNFKTTGSVEISGTLSSPSSSYISPIVGLKLGNEGLRLGRWNLATRPIIQVRSDCSLEEFRAASGYNLYTYNVTEKYLNTKITRNGSGYAYDIVETVIYNEDHDGFFSLPIEYDSHHATIVINSKEIPKTLYKDSLVQIKTYKDNSSYLINTSIRPTSTTHENKPAIKLHEIRHSYIRNEAIIVMTKLPIFENGDFKYYYSSKVFSPKKEYYNKGAARPYQWTDQELKNKGYYR